jgi:RNA polymerase sigma factor (sigma-70 family)
MKQHDGLVHACIRRQGSGDICYEEALQAGRIGLWRAIQGYDPTRGTAFSTYAWVAIYRHIRRRNEELKPKTKVWSQEVPTSWTVPHPAEEVERQLIQDVLHALVGQLPKRLWQVIVGRYGLGGASPCTLKELGKVLGLSGERVRQLQQDALAQNAALRRSRRRTCRPPLNPATAPPIATWGSTA